MSATPLNAREKTRSPVTASIAGLVMLSQLQRVATPLRSSENIGSSSVTSCAPNVSTATAHE